MSYYELWNVLWNWKKEFTVKEFSSVFSSPDANKVLHDMTQKGLLDRSGWGEYKVNSPEQYLAKKTNVSRAYELLNEANMDYALTGPDAVFFWTKGGYQVDRFFGFYPIHLKVRKEDLRKWEKFLRSRKHRFHVRDQPVKETLFGLFYVLYPEKDFKTENVEAFRVDPLKDTVEFCQSKIYSYEPALEMLDEMYSLGLKVEYKETKTNV
ncbi:MAG TPA: hypothetical protein VMT42_05320 [candidate division Zixibacteria bacterium]|nr:hypothetical protein [candidate division Zixibacteria bacterium]